MAEYPRPYADGMVKEGYDSMAGLSYSNKPKTDSQPISQQYGILSEELQILAKEVDVMRERLAPILGSDHPPICSQSEDEVERALSPLGESLRSDVRRVRNITEMVRHLMNRIEV